MVVSDIEVVCRFEAQRVLTSLRGNRKYGDLDRGWRELEESSPIRQLSQWRSGPQATPAELLEILLQIVKSPEFAGPATYVALEAVHSVATAFCEGDENSDQLAEVLASISDSVCGCVFAETSAQVDEATTMQMITVLAFCGTYHVGHGAGGFAPEVRMRAFTKVLSLWSHYRNSPTLRSGAQSCLQRMLDFVCAHIEDQEVFLHMVMRRFLEDISPKLAVDQIVLYLRCLQRLITNPIVKQCIGQGGSGVQIFQNDVPVVLAAIAEHCGANIRVLSLLLPIVNRVCWLCIGNWVDLELSARLVGFGALQVEALVSHCYIRVMNQAAVPLQDAEGSAAGLSVAEGMDLLVVLLESLCDLLKDVAVRTLWYSFDVDWRRPAIIEQLVQFLVKLLHSSPPNTERPLPGYVIHLSATVLMLIMSAFQDSPGAQESQTVEATTFIQEQQRRRAAVSKFLENLEAKPKKAKQVLLDSGILDFIEVHGVAPPCPASQATGSQNDTSIMPEVFEEWAIKLAWLFRCWNHAIPYPAMGECFGQPSSDAEQAFAAFVDTFEWGGGSIDEAMRSLLQAFLLPKEAQQIDRVLKVFAHTYYRKLLEHYRSSGSGETSYLRHPDAAYTLAFSVIMLNVDQHNPRLKKRMTLKEFMSNNRGINEGQNVPENVQTRIFDSIHKDEIKTPSTGNLSEGVSPSRWADLMQLVERGYRDNALVVNHRHLGSHALALLDSCGEDVRKALEFALAVDPSGHSDAACGLESLLHLALSNNADRLADSVVETLFFFGTEVFHESHRGSMGRASQSLRALFLTALAHLAHLSMKQLHMLVYITIQFALYGLIEKAALPPLDPTMVKLFRIPALLVDPPTGVVYSLLRKISTVPFRMLSFTEDDVLTKGREGDDGTPSKNGKTKSPVADTPKEEIPQEEQSTQATSESSSEIHPALDGVTGLSISPESSPEPSNCLPDDISAQLESPLWPQIEKTFEGSGLDTFVSSLLNLWRSENGDVSASHLGPETSGAHHACLSFVSSLFLTLRVTGQSKANKDQDVPLWLEDDCKLDIAVPSTLQLPKRALSLNVFDGFETVRLGLRLVHCTLGAKSQNVCVSQADFAPLQELSVCIHMGLCHTLRRNDLSERTLRVCVISIFQIAIALLPLRSERRPVVSLGWPIRLIEILVQRTKGEPQLLVTVARLSSEMVRLFITEVSRFRLLNNIELWRHLLQLLLKAVPTTVRALWPGAKDGIVQKTQLHLWQHGIIWVLGHPCLLDCLSLEGELAEKGDPPEGAAAASFWTWSLGELVALAEEMLPGNKVEAARLLLEAYRALLGYILKAAEPATSGQNGVELACKEGLSADPASSNRMATRAAAWSRVAVALLGSIGPLLSRKDAKSNDSETLVPLLKQTLLHVNVPILLSATPHGPHWARATLEKLVSMLTTAASSGASTPIEVLRETVPLVAKFLLQNLHALQRHDCFGQLWLMVLRLMLSLIKRGSDAGDELETLATEALKNLLRVLLNTKRLGFVSPKGGGAESSPQEAVPVWWQMTWDNIDVFLPGFGDECSKSIKPETEQNEAVTPAAMAADDTVVSVSASSVQEAPAAVPPQSEANTTPEVQAVNAEAMAATSAALSVSASTQQEAPAAVPPQSEANTAPEIEAAATTSVAPAALAEAADAVVALPSDEVERQV